MGKDHEINACSVSLAILSGKPILCMREKTCHQNSQEMRFPQGQANLDLIFG